MSEHIPYLSRRTFIGAGALLGAAALVSATPVAAFATPSAAEKQAEADEALNKLNAMQEKQGKAEADYFTALEEQQAAQDKMDECQARIDEANGQIGDLQEKLGTRARSMYRSGSLTFLDLLLGATSFQAFTSNWDLLNDMNQEDADMVQQTKDLRAEVQSQKEEYSAQEKVAEQKAKEMAAIKEEADRLVAETQAVYDNLSAEAAELLAQEQAAREAAEAAARAAADEAARQQAQQSSGGSSSGGGSSTGGSSSGGGSSTGGGSSNNSNNNIPQSTGYIAVDRAYSQIGKPYAWGAVGPNSFDCSGLVSYCLTGSYSRLGTTYTFMGWPRVTDPQPGDVCVNSSHCGIYIGGGQMIHAPHTGSTVRVGPVQSSMIYVRY